MSGSSQLSVGQAVDWEFAGTLGARLTRPGPPASDYTRRQAIDELARASRTAEAPVRDVTGLFPDAPVADARIVDRREWVVAASDSMRLMTGGAEGSDSSVTGRVAGAQTGAVLAFIILIIWVGTALTISTAGSRTAKTTAAASLKTVTGLAITAQQARADETLALIRRGDEDIRKRSYYQRVDSMQTQLTAYLARPHAIAAQQLADSGQLLTKWRQADERINAYIEVGDYQAATRVALGTAEDDSTPAFDKLNDALSNGIQESRGRLRGDILSARRVLSGTTVGGVLLSAGAAVAVALGLWPRMSEYR